MELQEEGDNTEAVTQAMMLVCHSCGEAAGKRI